MQLCYNCIGYAMIKELNFRASLIWSQRSPNPVILAR
jgi:hypothetical protein